MGVAKIPVTILSVVVVLAATVVEEKNILTIVKIARQKTEYAQSKIIYHGHLLSVWFVIVSSC